MPFLLFWQFCINMFEKWNTPRLEFPSLKMVHVMLVLTSHHHGKGSSNYYWTIQDEPWADRYRWSYSPYKLKTPYIIPNYQVISPLPSRGVITTLFTTGSGGHTLNGFFPFRALGIFSPVGMRFQTSPSQILIWMRLMWVVSLLGHQQILLVEPWCWYNGDRWTASNQ